MGWVCSAYEREERHIQCFGGERGHLGGPGVDGRII